MTVNPSRKKLLKTLRPLMYLSHLMGITFFSHVQKKRMKATIIYRIVVLSLLSLALIREIPTIMFWSRNLKGVHGMLAFIETRLRWFAVLANFLLTSHNNTNINNTLTKLINSPLILKQKEYNNILLYELLVLLFTTLLIIWYMCLGHDVLWDNPYHSWYTSTLYIITEFYIGFANLQFVILLIVIRKYFQALNENLKKCGFTPETCEKGETFVVYLAKGCKLDNITEIVKFRQIHMNLTTVSCKMNQCFSLQVLLFLVVSLIEITYSLRSVTVYSIKSNHKDTNQWKDAPLMELLLIFAWGGYYMWSILQIVFSCEATMLESQRTKAIVHELLNKIPDLEVSEQLQIFSLQIMNHNVFFTAGKFVTLNFPLLNSIIGTITTYLIIIMTFN